MTSTAECTVLTDEDALTVTIRSTFDHPVERVWQVWENPRLLERWWGPPTYPATFETFEFALGGRASYYMTGPDGDQPRGWWEFIAIDSPERIEIRDGFADENGEPVAEPAPTTFVVTLTPDASRTRMEVVSHFPDLETLKTMADMGMVEGMTEAAGQIPALLDELARAG